MSRTKIKLCPGCGRLPTLCHISDDKYYYSCDYSDCNLNPVTPAYKNKCSATRAWNKRYTRDIEVDVARKIFADIEGKVVTKAMYHGEVIWESEIKINDLKKKYGVLK